MRAQTADLSAGTSPWEIFAGNWLKFTKKKQTNKQKTHFLRFGFLRVSRMDSETEGLVNNLLTKVPLPFFGNT